MKLPCIAVLSVAMPFFSTQVTKEPRIAADVRRFVSVFDWAIQDSNLRPRLERVIGNLATELQLNDSTREKLLDGLPKTLAIYRIEQATVWSQPKNADRVNAEAWSLKSSTHLIELSAAWRDLVQSSLSPAEFRVWEGTSVERNKRSQAQLARLADVKQKKRQLMRFRGAPTDGVSRLADTLAFGRFRRQSSAGISEYLKAARRDIVKRGDRARAATRLEYEIRIMELDFACSLTDPQKAKLRLLVKGVVAKRHAETDLQVESYLEHLREPKYREPTWTAQLRELEPKPSKDKTHSVFWDRMVGKILTSRQKKILETHRPK